MVLALLTVFFGIVALYAAYYFYGKVRSERDWPTVYGRILERGLGRMMSTPSRSYLPHVKYTYSVDGQEYTNDQVYLIRGTGGTRGSIMRLVTGLPDPVPV